MAKINEEEKCFYDDRNTMSIHVQIFVETTTKSSYNSWPPEKAMNTLVHTALRCIISTHCQCHFNEEL